MNLKFTEVFGWHWEAMHLKAYNVVIKNDVISFLCYDVFRQDYINKKEFPISKIDLSKYKLEKHEDITYLTDVNALNEFPELLQNRYKYIVHKGSSRSSKTISLIDAINLYAQSKPNQRCTIWRDTKTDCKKTVLSDTLKHLRNTNRFYGFLNFNKTESILSYPNGSNVEIHGTDDEETVHGLTQNVAWINEPYKISKDTFDQIDQRTSDFIFIDWNPKKDSWIDDVEKRHNAIVIKSTFKNNYYCPIGSRNKLLSYQTIRQSNIVRSGVLDEITAFNYNHEENPLQLGESDLKELIRCIVNEKQKSANAFKWSVYGEGEKGEVPNRIYNWNKINYIDYLNLPFEEWYGCDWGKVDPWAIVGGKYDPNTNRLYVHEYNYLSEDQILKKLSNEDKRYIQSQGDEGLVTWMFSKLNIPLSAKIVCDDNRPLKVMKLKDYGYYNAVTAYKSAGSIVDGIELLSYGVDVYYTDISKKIEEEQEEYSWKTDRYGKTLEVPEGGKDHTLDAVKYLTFKMLEYRVIKVV